MKIIRWGFGLLVLMVPLFWSVQAQTPPTLAPTLTASPAMPPSATAGQRTPPPTATTTTTPVADIPVLPVLKPIDKDNLEQLQPLMLLQCAEANPALYSDGIRDILWSPAGNLLAIVQFNQVCLYDFASPQTGTLMIDTHDVWAAVFSADGAELATLHNGTPSVRLWDTETGARKSTSLIAGYNFGGRNSSLAYSSDGKYIATVGFRSGLRLYDAATEKLLVRAQIASQRAVYFSGDGKRIVTVGNDDINLWTIYPGPRLFLDQTIVVEYPNYSLTQVQIVGEKDGLLYYRAGGHLYSYDLVQDKLVDDRSDDDGTIFLPDGTLSSLFASDAFQYMSPAFTHAAKMTFSSDGTLLATIPFNQQGDTVQNADVVQLWGIPQ